MKEQIKNYDAEVVILGDIFDKTPPLESPTSPPSEGEGEEKRLLKMPSTEEELEAMIQARIDKALEAKMDEIMKMVEGKKAPAPRF